MAVAARLIERTLSGVVAIAAANAHAWALTNALASEPPRARVKAVLPAAW